MEKIFAIQVIETTLLSLAKKNFSNKDMEKFRFLFSKGCGLVFSEASKMAAKLLFEIFPDFETIAAALLHEHYLHTSKSFFLKFGGKNFFELLEKLHSVSFAKERTKEELLRSIFLALRTDIRIAFFLLAERHALLMLSYSILPEKKVYLGKEVFELMSPLAYRMGAHVLKEDLENRAFSLLFSEDFKIIFDERSEFLRKKEPLFHRVIDRIRNVFRKKNIPLRMQSRVKGIYSIFLKMQRKGRSSLEDMHDVFALRIIVNSKEDCYRALGEIHSLFPPLPGRMKDYIALPKSNGYQSLHTTVSIFLEEGMIPLEVQIRTDSMHKIAEDGFASHLLYKKSKTKAFDRKPSEDVQKQKMRSITSRFSHQDFLKNASEDLFADRIFAFTPSGEIKIFPRNATVLDFAYALHSHIGNYAEKGMKEGKEVDLFNTLENGDTLQIITHPNIPQVQDEWLLHAKTPIAQKAIRSFLREKEEDAYFFDRS